ncbi:hypothetical protein PENTCL1PPCAC_30695 [Pristionchus entomophagus]|uniref:Uncharacterized protein n=1 Tax=Pristionchus entomophagus TaxID=358040 RepID=A0AAV5UN72_9BILA|nr:hypothetical protein PENTCL1PPCAC_30695 [Pristionchus entomophagus]
MGENLMRIHHRKQILGGLSSQARRENSLQRGLAEIIRDSEQKEKRKDKEGESMEMRLLAEQLSRRLETKFERSHEMQKEQERNETERRLRQIGESYEREIRAKEKNMERERALMVERLAEKEKKMMREVELKMDDRESRLELEKRRLENRLIELMSGKEELERARKELRKEIESEMERLRLEKESLQERERRLLREEKLSSVVDGIEEERQRNHGRMAYLEATVSQLRERLHKSEEERRESNATITLHEATKAELIVAKNNYLRQLEESRRLGEKLREKEDYDEIRMENDRLKIELGNSRRKIRSEEERERMKSETMEQLEIEASKNKVKELKIILSMMSDKMREVTADRDYLRKECRELRKERIQEKKKETKMMEIMRDKNTKLRRFSSLSSLSSSFEDNITDVQKRINKMETLSHELEETLHAVCIIPNPEIILTDRSRRSEENEEIPSPIDYSLREKREDTVERERMMTTVSSPIDRYEGVEIKKTNYVPVNDSEERRVSPPIEGRRDSMKEWRREEMEEWRREERSITREMEELESGMNMGIDPVMAQYMKIVMERRNKEKEEEGKAEAQSASEVQKEEEEMEEFKVDTVDTVGDDEGFEW